MTLKTTIKKEDKVNVGKKSKWSLSRHEFMTVYHYALQYSEWHDRLNALTDSVGTVASDGQPHGNYAGNPTEKLGIKRADLDEKINTVESTVKEAVADCEYMYPYLLRAVTDSDVTFDYLRMVMDLPCGKNVFYEYRRKFYYLLSKKLDL